MLKWLRNKLSSPKVEGYDMDRYVDSIDWKSLAISLPPDFDAYIQSIDWDNLKQAYGKATRMPDFLRLLCSPRENNRMEAVNDGLWSRANHQGSHYSCTPYVTQALWILLQTPSALSLENKEGDFNVTPDVMGFIQDVFDRPGDFPEFSAELLQTAKNNTEIIRAYQTNADTKVGAAAKSLLNSILAVR